MGHYYAEMACPKCGFIPCRCPREKPKPNKKWIVDFSDDYKPIQVDDFDKKYAVINTRYGTISGNPHISRMGRKEFETKAKCKAHAKDLIRESIEHHEQAIAELRKLL